MPGQARQQDSRAAVQKTDRAAAPFHSRDDGEDVVLGDNAVRCGIAVSAGEPALGGSPNQSVHQQLT